VFANQFVAAEADQVMAESRLEREGMLMKLTHGLGAAGGAEGEF
jgi:hypothetical protein